MTEEQSEQRQTALQIRDSRVFAFMSELEKASKLPEKVQTGIVKMLEKKIQYIMDWEIAEMISYSDLVPKEYIGKPQNVFMAMQSGRSLGLDEFQSVKHQFTINGRTGIFGDMMLALVKTHSEYDDCLEEFGDLVDVDKEHGQLPKYAKCTIKRKNGKSDIVRTYTIEDAMRNANFDKKGKDRKGNYTVPGTWMRTGARMMQMRARSFALRDAFPDKLSGVYDEYEIRDIHEAKDITDQVQDLGQQSASDTLKDIVSEDSDATDADVTIETDQGQKEGGQEESAEQQKPENLKEIKQLFAELKKNKLIENNVYKEYTEAGRKGQWDIVIQMYEERKEGFVVKLSKVVDDPEYKEIIDDLIADGKIEVPDENQNILRTKDEREAKQIFELIEKYKSFHDQEKEDASKDN